MRQWAKTWYSSMAQEWVGLFLCFCFFEFFSCVRFGLEVTVSLEVWWHYAGHDKVPGISSCDTVLEKEQVCKWEATYQLYTLVGNRCRPLVKVGGSLSSAVHTWR